MMQEKRYTSEYIFHRQTDENWSSSKAGVQPGTQMLQCFNLQISCCLADSSARIQTVKIQFPGRIRCLRIVFLETSTLNKKLFTLAWRNHRRTEQDHSQRQQKSLSLLSLESPPEGRCSSPVNPLSQKDTLLFSSPPIALSISVARSLSTKKGNLLQTSMLPDLRQGFGSDCCTSRMSTHIRSGSPAPSPSPRDYAFLPW